MTATRATNAQTGAGGEADKFSDEQLAQELLQNLPLEYPNDEPAGVGGQLADEFTGHVVDEDSWECGGREMTLVYWHDDFEPDESSDEINIDPAGQAIATQLGSEYRNKPVDLDEGVPFDIYELFRQVTGRDYDFYNAAEDELTILEYANAFERAGQMESNELVFPGDVATVAARIGSSLMPDNAKWMNRFTVKSTSSNSVYTVAQRREDGVWGCSCRGWIHYRHCKHLDDILGRLAAIPTLSTAPQPSQPVEGKVSSNVMDILASARQAHANLRGK